MTIYSVGTERFEKLKMVLSVILIEIEAFAAVNNSVLVVG